MPHRAWANATLNLKNLPIDMLSLSGHKLYGPKGVGVLIVRPTNRDFELKPLLFGGDQEKHSLRPGTLNVPGIVGFGEACETARLTMDGGMRAHVPFSNSNLEW